MVTTLNFIGGWKSWGNRTMAYPSNTDVKDKPLDFSNLEAKLGELNAQAFMDAERACRMKADATPDITYSAGFRARLAARALGVDFKEVQSLSLGEFTEITGRVLNFLLQPSAEKLMGGEG